MTDLSKLKVLSTEQVIDLVAFIRDYPIQRDYWRDGNDDSVLMEDATGTLSSLANDVLRLLEK